MSQEDTPIARAKRPGGDDKLRPPEGRHLAPDEAGHARQSYRTDDEEDHDERRPDRGRHGDQEQQRWERERHIGQAHHDRVHPATVVPGEKSQQDPQDDRDGLRDQTHGKREPSPVQHAAEHVPPLGVGPQEETPAGLEQVGISQVARRGSNGADPRRQHRRRDHQGDQDRSSWKPSRRRRSRSTPEAIVVP